MTCIGAVVFSSLFLDSFIYSCKLNIKAAIIEFGPEVCPLKLFLPRSMLQHHSRRFRATLVLNKYVIAGFCPRTTGKSVRVVRNKVAFTSCSVRSYRVVFARLAWLF